MRILLSFANGLRDAADLSRMPCFYEAFVRGLHEAGNDLLVFHGVWNQPFQGEMGGRVLAEAKAWGPELVVTFNNYGPDWASCLDCPIAVYEVDSPLYYQNPERLRACPDRFDFFVMQERSREILVGQFGVPPSHVHLTTHFTEVRAEPRPFVRNIAFVGSRFYVNREGHPWDLFMRGRPDAQKVGAYAALLAALRDNPFLTVEELSARHPSLGLTRDAVHTLVFALSMEKRVQTLSAVADLGLELRGTGEWPSVACECADLALAYRPDPIVTVRDNQDFYNASRLCLNVNHLQAVSSFSWRVFDIMASNGCLVAEARGDFKRLFPGVPIPSFENRFEAREQCCRLLRDEARRQDIVAASHEAIEPYRFTRVLSLMEAALGLGLRGPTTGAPVRYLAVPETVRQERKAPRPASYVIRRRLAGLVPFRSMRRGLRRRLDLEWDVFSSYFAHVIAKKNALERVKDDVRCVILGSSHAYFGYWAQQGEFNLADVSLDLKSCQALLDYWLGRGLPRLARVVVFFDVFSPGNVLEKSSECFRRIPYVDLYGFDCPQGRSDTSIGCDYAFAEAAFRRYRHTRRVSASLDACGNYEADGSRHALSDDLLEKRISSHIRLSTGSEMGRLEALRTALTDRKVELIVVLPPLRSDYLAELARQGYDWQKARAMLTGFSVCDLHDHSAFRPEDFFDMDHLNGQGARKLAQLVRVF